MSACPRLSCFGSCWSRLLGAMLFRASSSTARACMRERRARARGRDREGRVVFEAAPAMSRTCAETIWTHREDDSHPGGHAGGSARRAPNDPP